MEEKVIFSDDIVELINTRFEGADIYSMSLDELKRFRDEVDNLRHEYFLLEMAMKTLGNAAYGAAANQYFYFFNINLASDITGECRLLTKTMWDKMNEFFHETLWERKDLWEKFNFKLDESKHDWYREQPVSIYSDTDSVYTTYGTLFQCMDKESQERYKTDDDKIQWILKFNKEFLDKQNNEWCDAMYNPRHGHNIHEFELETISKAGIYLKKKKYLKGLSYSKGNFYAKPKVSGTGIELIKSTTPELCRKILKDLMESLMFEYSDERREEFLVEFNDKLYEYRKEFYAAPIESISQSVGIGNYKKYVLNDQDELILGKQTPVSVHAIARYNHLAHKNGQDNLKTISGKIKYYNIYIGKQHAYFGFPAGELPSWAPPMHKITQWEKTVINPINRFCEVMKLPLVGTSNAMQLTLF